MPRLHTPFSARATADDVLAGVDLTGKRALVTGGASGLGAETVRALARAGADVVIATRDPRGAAPILREFANVTVDALDLADLESVRAFTARWRGPLHMAVANAGIMALPERRLSPQKWELQLATNFLGHHALLIGLHEHLRAAGRARVVTVSSGAQVRSPVVLDDLQFDRRPYDPWVAYAQSKSAVVLLAVEAARRWAPDGISANSCAPGSIHTNLQRHLDPATMRALGALDDDGNLVTTDRFKSAAQGASTSVLLAASPLLEGVTGRYFEDNQEAEVVPGGPEPTGGVAEWSVDPDLASRLWDTAAAVR
jgi:NAD(P)-dependent dehydrogenase (short-subunit alcohol dehydrogenase family)